LFAAISYPFKVDGKYPVQQGEHQWANTVLAVDKENARAMMGGRSNWEASMIPNTAPNVEELLPKIALVILLGLVALAVSPAVDSAQSQKSRPEEVSGA